MSEKSAADPLDLVQISKEVLASQQKFMPSGQVYAKVAEAMRDVAQANATYMQELMRANAILLAAFMQRPSGVADERPSDACHRSDSAAS
jgi:hypothetical protein